MIPKNEVRGKYSLLYMDAGVISILQLVSQILQALNTVGKALAERQERRRQQKEEAAQRVHNAI